MVEDSASSRKIGKYAILTMIVAIIYLMKYL